MNLIEAIIDLVDRIISDYVFGAYTNLSPSITALWNVLFVIFIAFYGYKIIFSGSFGFNDFIVSTFKIILILILATSWDVFAIFFFESFTEFPSEVAGRVLAGSASSVSGTATATDISTADKALGDFYDRGMLVGNQIVSSAGWREVGLYFYAMFVWITTLLVCAFALMLIILSKLAVSVLLSIAPIFILMLMFSSSRGFFEGWFRALVNYSVIPVFVYSVLALVLRVLNGPLEDLEANVSSDSTLLSYLGPFVLVGVIGFVLLTQVMTIAAAISGGFALSTMGFAGGVASKLGKLATGGRIGREARELAYLRATPAMQKALTNARFGRSGDIHKSDVLRSTTGTDRPTTAPASTARERPPPAPLRLSPPPIRMPPPKDQPPQ